MPSTPPYPLHALTEADISGHGRSGVPRGRVSTATPPEQTPPLRLALHRLNGRRVFGEAVPLPEEGAVLGNDSVDALPGLALDASVMVARTHARIIPLCGHWMLSLADERMVCAINGHKVPWGELYTLQAGDSIQLGFAELRVESAESGNAHPLDFLAGMDMNPAQIAEAGMAHPPTPPTTLGVGHSSPTPPSTVEDHAVSLHDSSGLGNSGHDSLKDDSGSTRGQSDTHAHAEEEALSPEEVLLRQLDADFSTSATGRALHYQWGGQPLDAILGPEPPLPAAPTDLPALTGLADLAGVSGQKGLTEHAAAAPQDDDRAFFAQLAQTDLPYPTQFPQPNIAPSAPNPDLYSADASPTPFLPPPTPSTASPAPQADPLPLDPANEESLLSLEDILDGPLHIDDVLRGLGDNSDSLPRDTNEAALFSLDVLQEEIPPDPLSLLPPCTEHAPLASQPLYPPLTGTPAAWPGLSPLLQREHHQSGLHSPYTLTTTAPKDTESA